MATHHGNTPAIATQSLDTANLDITEGCKLALSQSLDHHQGRHQLLLVNVLQDLSNVTFALLTRREVRKSLNPQIGILTSEREDIGEGGGRRVGEEGG